VGSTNPEKKFTRNFTDEFKIKAIINRKGQKENVVLAGPWVNKMVNKRKREEEEESNGFEEDDDEDEEEE
jgi:hypothetical protein